MSADPHPSLIIYHHRIRWVAAVNLAFVVGGLWLSLRYGSGLSFYAPVVFLGLYSLVWIRDLLFGHRLVLMSDGSQLRWEDGRASGSVLLADIRKILIGTKTLQVGDSSMGWTHVRLVLSSGSERDLPPNIASGLSAQNWRRLRQLRRHICTVSNVSIEPIREPGIALEGWEDEPETPTGGVSRGAAWNRMTLRRKISLVLCGVLVLPLAVFLGNEFVYQPLKFQRLISRVESASTPAEEREAFARAAGEGRVWELNRLRPEHLPDRARHLTGDWVLELEWMESSPWTGRPYRAYRRVLDTNNLERLYVRYGE